MNLIKLYCYLTHHDPVFYDKDPNWVWCNRCEDLLEKGEDYQ